MRWTELCGIPLNLCCLVRQRGLGHRPRAGAHSMLDTVIRGATVADGSGNAPFTGDVGIDVAGALPRWAASLARPGARSMRKALSSPPAGWTRTRTMTARSPGTLYLPPPPSMATTAVMGNCGGLCAREARAARLAHQRDGRRGGHSRQRAERRYRGPGRASEYFLTRWLRNRARAGSWAQVPHSAVRTYVMASG